MGQTCSWRFVPRSIGERWSEAPGAEKASESVPSAGTAFAGLCEAAVG